MNRKNPLEAIYAEKGAACSENKCFPGKGHLKLNNPLSFILFYFILVFLCNYTINNSLQKSVNMGQMVRGSYSALFLSILVTYLIKMGPSVTFKKRYLFSDNFSIVHMKKKVSFLRTKHHKPNTGVLFLTSLEIVFDYIKHIYFLSF